MLRHVYPFRGRGVTVSSLRIWLNYSGQFHPLKGIMCTKTHYAIAVNAEMKSSTRDFKPVLKISWRGFPKEIRYNFKTECFLVRKISKIYLNTYIIISHICQYYCLDIVRAVRCKRGLFLLTHLVLALFYRFYLKRNRWSILLIQFQW